jgi:hypothetical protein
MLGVRFEVTGMGMESVRKRAASRGRRPAQGHTLDNAVQGHPNFSSPSPYPIPERSREHPQKQQYRLLFPALRPVWRKSRWKTKDRAFLMKNGKKSSSPFYRTSSARADGTSGTGLGLAISERAVKLHDGTIEVSNRRHGKGLQVMIRIPVSPFRKS